jgi:PhoH-like ATPase
MSKKIYVLDTNILLTDPNALYNFGNNDIVLPFKVLEELDKKKSLPDVVGSNARHTIRELDNIRKKGSLSKGVKLDKGKGIIFVKETNPNDLPKDFEFSRIDTPDNKIVAVAYSEKINNQDKKVIIVSRDINIRIKADSLGIIAESYEIDKAVEKRESLYSGFASMLVDDQEVDKFYNGGDIFIDKEKYKFYPNQFIMLISSYNDKKTALAKFINYSTPLRKVPDFKKGIFDLIPKNKEQVFAMDLLMDPKIPLVSISGIAGGGKSLISIACGLQQVLGKDGPYKRFIIIRPIIPMGGQHNNIGFLPGDLGEKMAPWLQPINDNLRFLFGGDKAMLEQYINNGIIEIEALSFVRGRSISDAYLLIDECQNLSLHELKTLITRVGMNTKIVINGDLEQIDNPYLNEFTSGFTNVIEKFRKEEVAAHITLTKGERSVLASIAAKIL